MAMSLIETPALIALLSAALPETSARPGCATTASSSDIDCCVQLRVWHPRAADLQHLPSQATPFNERTSSDVEDR